MKENEFLINFWIRVLKFFKIFFRDKWRVGLWSVRIYMIVELVMSCGSIFVVLL